MSTDLLKNAIFQLFLKEIEPLGFKVSNSPSPESRPYAVVGGRSNARWWLIPLANRHVATSGLAMFQPIISSAKALKYAATSLNAVGLSKLWTRNRLYISGDSLLSDIFRNKKLHHAFFTGTNSPHRKTAVQIMDCTGAIKGFAKISITPAAKRLIEDERNSLDYVQALKLNSVKIPRVILSQELDGAKLLVTDTEKTRFSKTLTAFTIHHKTFLDELNAKTSDGEAFFNSRFLDELNRQTILVSDKLPEQWADRLSSANRYISAAASIVKEDMVYCHGDFTPWNTFMAGDKLYVFDWEYAKQGYPPGYDLINFILSLPAMKRQSVSVTIRQARKTLQEMMLAGDDTIVDTFLLCYLCSRSLLYIIRESEVAGKVSTWDGEKELAAFIDAIIARKN